MADKTRAAVVLFVDVDSDLVSEPSDIGMFIKQGLFQAGFSVNSPLKVKFRDKEIPFTIVDCMDAGMAIGNGYLWAQVTPKAFQNHSRYTEKELKRLQDDHR